MNVARRAGETRDRANFASWSLIGAALRIR